MYYLREISDSLSGETIEHITLMLGPDRAVSFPNIETNAGPERAAYLAWLAEGNTPELWNPEGQ